MRDLTVAQLMELIDGTLLTQAGTDKEISSGCVCDLLSWVMAHARPGGVWVTVQTHLNVVAVAELSDLACVVLPCGMEMEQAALEKAGETGLAVLSSPMSAFDIAGILYAQNVRGA